MSELHYGSETFALAAEEDLTRLAESIEERVRNRGGWVEIVTTTGTVMVFVTPGVPIWMSGSA